MKQINQKAISAKINKDVYERAEIYCEIHEMKRNRLINLALSEYIDRHNNV